MAFTNFSSKATLVVGFFAVLGFISLTLGDLRRPLVPTDTRANCWFFNHTTPVGGGLVVATPASICTEALFTLEDSFGGVLHRMGSVTQAENWHATNTSDLDPIVRSTPRTPFDEFVAQLYILYILQRRSLGTVGGLIRIASAVLGISPHGLLSILCCICPTLVILTRVVRHFVSRVRSTMVPKTYGFPTHLGVFKAVPIKSISGPLVSEAKDLLAVNGRFDERLIGHLNNARMDYRKRLNNDDFTAVRLAVLSLTTTAMQYGFALDYAVYWLTYQVDRVIPHYSTTYAINWSSYLKEKNAVNGVCPSKEALCAELIVNVAAARLVLLERRDQGYGVPEGPVQLADLSAAIVPEKKSAQTSVEGNPAVEAPKPPPVPREAIVLAPSEEAGAIHAHHEGLGAGPAGPVTQRHKEECRASWTAAQKHISVEPPVNESAPTARVKEFDFWRLMRVKPRVEGKGTMKRKCVPMVKGGRVVKMMSAEEYQKDVLRRMEAFEVEREQAINDYRMEALLEAVYDGHGEYGEGNTASAWGDYAERRVDAMLRTDEFRARMRGSLDRANAALKASREAVSSLHRVVGGGDVDRTINVVFNGPSWADMCFEDEDDIFYVNPGDLEGAVSPAAYYALPGEEPSLHIHLPEMHGPGEIIPTQGYVGRVRLNGMDEAIAAAYAKWRKTDRRTKRLTTQVPEEQLERIAASVRAHVKEAYAPASPSSSDPEDSDDGGQGPGRFFPDLPKELVHPARAKGARKSDGLKASHPVVEGPVEGSKPSALVLAAAEFSSDGATWVQNGTLLRAPGGLYFLTHRHKVFAGGVVTDGFPTGNKTQMTSITFSGGTALRDAHKVKKATTMYVTGPYYAPDLVAINFTVADQVVKKALDEAKIPAMGDLPKPQSGAGVTAVHMTTYIPDKQQWHVGAGNAQLTPNLVRYDIGTMGGSCGTPVFDQQNRIVAIHMLSKVQGQQACHPLPAGFPIYGINFTSLAPTFVDAATLFGKQAVSEGEQPLSHVKNQGFEFPVPPVVAGQPTKKKIYPPNKFVNDRVRETFHAKYILAKGGMAEIPDEIAKFLNMDAQNAAKFERPTMRRAMEHVYMRENAATRVYPINMETNQVPVERYREAIDCLAMDSTAGEASFTLAGARRMLSQLQFFDVLGGGEGQSCDDECVLRGKELFAYAMADYVHKLNLIGMGEQVAMDEYERMMFGYMTHDILRWRVFSKKDRYKLEKLESKAFRTIQSPSIELKVLWLVCMGESDECWNKGYLEYATGEDMDMPVPAALAEAYINAHGSLSTDMTGFDRDMPAAVMEDFFDVYVRSMCKGIPAPLLHLLRYTTIHSHLVLPDGRLIQKHRGNPSGFPNTLRLNSVVMRACTTVVLAQTFDMSFDEVDANFLVEVCGDDSRIWAFRPGHALRLGDTLEVWRFLFPWKVKEEGSAVWNGMQTTLQQKLLMAPPMISRCLVWKYNAIWRPIYNLDRVYSKSFFAPADGSEAETHQSIVQGVLAATPHLIYWQSVNFFYDERLVVMSEVFPELYERALISAQNRIRSAVWGDEKRADAVVPNHTVRHASALD